MRVIGAIILYQENYSRQYYNNPDQSPQYIQVEVAIRLLLGVHPAHLHGVYAALLLHGQAYAVYSMQQLCIIRHISVLRRRNVRRHQHIVLYVVFPHQPLQHHRVPQRPAFLVAHHIEYRHSHVFLHADKTIRHTCIHEGVVGYTSLSHMYLPFAKLGYCNMLHAVSPWHHQTCLSLCYRNIAKVSILKEWTYLGGKRQCSTFSLHIPVNGVLVAQLYYKRQT